MKKVLVTGADGMLGSHICRDLLDRGYAVRAMIQSGRETGTIENLDVERVTGDLLSREDVYRAVQGSDYVIHTAANTQIWPGRSELIWKINFDAVTYIADAVQEYGISRFIHVGTANSFGPGTKDAPGTEENGYTDHRYRLDYQDSKHAAQEYLLQRHTLERLPVLILNPGFMLGAWDSKPGAGEMLLAIHEGRTPGYAPGGKTYIAASDVSRTATDALTAGQEGECYILGGENLSYREAFAMMAEVTGSSTPSLKIPAFAVWLYGLWGSVSAAILRREPNLTLAMARISNADCYYSSRKAREELNFSPGPVKDGMRACFEWLQKHGYTKTDT